MLRVARWSLLFALPLLLLPGGGTLLRAQQQPPASAVAAPADAIARGRYIVEDVALCGRCHSPVDEHGTRDQSRWLLGGQVAIESTLPVGGDWAILAPRLAGSVPGTDAQFIVLMMTGISRTGHVPRQPMPQFRLSQPDAEAVLAYLKSLGGRTTVSLPVAPTLTRK